MPEEPVNAENSLEAQLVAYLDGELDAQSSRQIEELLAADPEIRRKLQTLERTWEMLEELETTPVDDQFTRTTLEMVAVAAQSDVRKSIEEAPQRRRRWWLRGGAVLLAAGLAGFLAVAWMFPDPNRQLLNNLPLLENLDEYRQVEDIQFLRILQKERLLEKQEVIAPGSPPLVAKKDQVEYIKNLGPGQKAELLRKQERFASLDPAKQEQLWQLYEQIQRDPHADDLRGIMHAYYEWWKSLPAYGRDELTALPAAERIKWINKRLQEDQARSITRPPTDKDAQELWRWMEEYAAKVEKPFLDTLPQMVQQRLSGMVALARRRAVMWMIWQRPQGPANKIAQPAEGDLAELMAKFTPETRKRLEATTAADRMRTIQNWAHNLLRQRITRQGPGITGLVDDERLAEFFEKDLTNEQRDRLMGLPGEDMQRELVRLYIMQTRQVEDHPHRPDGFAPGPFEGGPGPGMPPPETRENPPPHLRPDLQPPPPNWDHEK